MFGIPRKTVASFEVPVLKTSGNFGKIDLLWKGVLLVEHKSAGEDLGNPPFIGKHLMNAEQSQDMELVWGETNGAGFLDYVTGWYLNRRLHTS